MVDTREGLGVQQERGGACHGDFGASGACPPRAWRILAIRHPVRAGAIAHQPPHARVVAKANTRGIRLSDVHTLSIAICGAAARAGGGDDGRRKVAGSEIKVDDRCFSRAKASHEPERGSVVQEIFSP
ncbi:hypothetical protein G6F57_020997 [Rhizopus arrhizus]|nr:hypothetical protein G6F57_020997 [Rhizopus arrhizus]